MTEKIEITTQLEELKEAHQKELAEVKTGLQKKYQILQQDFERVASLNESLQREKGENESASKKSYQNLKSEVDAITAENHSLKRALESLQTAHNEYVEEAESKLQRETESLKKELGRTKGFYIEGNKKGMLKHQKQMEEVKQLYEEEKGKQNELIRSLQD